MSYTNIKNSVEEIKDYIKTNCATSGKPSFLQKHICLRGRHLVLVPTTLITGAVNTIIGLGAGIGAILTLGRHEPTYSFAKSHITSSNYLFSKPYAHFLKTINPQAQFGDKKKTFATQLTRPVIDFVKTLEQSDNFLKRHVVTRLTYVVLAVSFIITRVVDAILAIPLAAASIVTLGKFETLNNWAYGAFKAPGIIYDLFALTMRFINPCIDIPENDTNIHSDKKLVSHDSNIEEFDSKYLPTPSTVTFD